MIWQVVPSIGTCKSINLDLARAARCMIFYHEATCSCRSILRSTNLLPTLVLLYVKDLVVLRHGVDRAGWPRRRRAGLLSRPATHAHTGTPTRSHTRAHTPHANSSRLSHTHTALILERDNLVTSSCTELSTAHIAYHASTRINLSSILPKWSCLPSSPSSTPLG